MNRRMPGKLAYLLLCCLIIAIAPAVTAAESLTRGSMFTVSIAGRPGTPYYVWFTRTSAMSGEPGDQPPVIVGNTERVEFDPDGGPYAIGSYRFNNGNGRTILDDVAPSSATTSNTRYYAKVTTDADGFGIVQFSTSSATAARSFPIRSENPASPGEAVPVKLGLPEKNTPPTTTKDLPVTKTTTLPPVTLTLPVITEAPSALPVTTAVPPSGKKASIGMVTILLAAGAAVLLVRRPA